MVGNVEIGNSTGDEINRDINNVQETTKDKDSGYYNTFVESGVLVLTTKEGRGKFKESVGLAGQEVDRVIDTMVESYDTVKDILNSNKNDKEKAKEIVKLDMEVIMYYELVSLGTITDYRDAQISELVKNDPDFIKKIEDSKNDANNVLAVVGQFLGLDDINKVRQSDDYLKNLSEEFKLMEKIETLRNTRQITDNQARELMYGLYSVMYPDLLATKYLENNKKIVEQASIKIVNQYGNQLEQAMNGNISPQDYKDLLNNISKVFMNDYGINGLNSRVIDSSNDVYFTTTGDPEYNFIGIRKGVDAVITKPLTLEEKKDLINNGYKLKEENGIVYLEFSSQREIWLNLNSQVNSNANNPIYMAGTSGHEIGHDNDLTLKPKTKEEKLLVEIFKMTGRSTYAGVIQNTPGYNLRGTELFQYELGNFIRVKISEEMNKLNIK